MFWQIAGWVFVAALALNSAYSIPFHFNSYMRVGINANGDPLREKLARKFMRNIQIINCTKLAAIGALLYFLLDLEPRPFAFWIVISCLALSTVYSVPFHYRKFVQKGVQASGDPIAKKAATRYMRTAQLIDCSKLGAIALLVFILIKQG